ncbi:MAG: alanine--tRNA ligase [Brevinematales bacterium]|nr:alanine--tRNA ligase [Brevinematales bacterium]
MKSDDIRQSFLDFFKSKGHTIVPSSSLIPENDPTLLFTNAGMNQFKDVFLGLGTREYKRAADTQKCMRVSGKHNDLEDVGKDGYHHTFFEMLGNWSFGDYYKKEAIEWAWELLTKVWKLPKDRLYATVHHTDDEAFKLWAEVTDIDKSHILKFGDKDNFWEMGATGPCGPCSEIHIDRGEESCDKKHIEGHKCSVNGGCARYIELWNLVFIQYNRNEDGSLTPLPNKHVDTGMGFERITSVIQGKISNYDTDIFSSIISAIEDLSGKKFSKDTETPIRVIADHIRTLTFAMSDGVMPSNEGRGYVIRKILRRAIRYGKYLGFEEPFLHKLTQSVVEKYGHIFPEVKDRQEMVKSLIFSEEEAFYKTIHRGLDKLNEIIDKCHKENKNIISGADLFMLYDSLGLPLDFIESITEDEKLTLDKAGFNKLMEEQKERARANWKNDAFNIELLKGKNFKTIYTGENKYEDSSKIIMIIEDNKEKDLIEQNKNGVIITSETPFYGEKGGQVGDKGFIKKDDGSIFEVNDTKIFEDTYIHIGKVVKGSFKKNDTVTLVVDEERRRSIARNHTATHLLHKALKKILGEHVAQAGSLVGPNGFRFDFTHFKAMSKEEIEMVENEVNKAILNSLPVSISYLPKEEAIKKGAVAIFEEKYGDIVRIVEVENYSKELCGGSHVKNTGEIGLFKIVSETSISAGTRRIEAITALSLLDIFRKNYMLLNEISIILNTKEDKILERIKSLLEEIKEKEKEIEDLKTKLLSSELDKIIEKCENYKGVKILAEILDKPQNELVSITDIFKTKIDKGIVFLLAKNADKVSIVCGITKNLTDKIKAKEVVSEIAKFLGGGGGGRDDFAQAGGKHTDKIEEALIKAKEIVINKLK